MVRQGIFIAFVGGWLSLGGALAVTGGCSSQAYSASSQTAGSLQGASAEINATRAQVDDAIKKLDTLMSSDGDLRKPYEAYCKSLDKLKEVAKKTESKANEMRDKGKEYFARWDHEVSGIKNEDIKARSEARRAEVAAQFKEVGDLYQAAKAEFVPFMSDLNDIRRALGTDLTKAGVAASQPVAAKAREGAGRIGGILNNLAAKFQEMGARLAPAQKS